MSLPHRNSTATRPFGTVADIHFWRWPAVSGLVVALVSAIACTWMWSEEWPALYSGTSPGLLLSMGGLVLALSGPIGLVVTIFTSLSRERTHRQDVRRRQSLRRRAQLDLLNMLPVAVAVCHMREARTALNFPMASLLQMEGGEAADHAMDWQKMVAAEDWTAWVEACEDVVRVGRTRWLRCAFQLADSRLEGLAQIASINGEDGVELVVIFTPSDGKGSLPEDTVLRLRDLLEMAEAEKWQFGQAVHDELGQRLSGIAYFAKALQRKLQKAGRAEAEDAGWLTRLANESMTTARGIARGLVPVGTDDPDALVMALDELCENAGKTFAIHCELSVDPGFDTGGAARATHLYHVVQELITNAIKHGRARRVQVKLEVLADGQLVTVRNDGIGFDKSQTRYGMGLNGVRNRAAYLGGKFALTDQDHGGILATIELPLPSGRVADTAPGQDQPSPGKSEAA